MVLVSEVDGVPLHPISDTNFAKVYSYSFERPCFHVFYFTTFLVSIFLFAYHRPRNRFFSRAIYACAYYFPCYEPLAPPPPVVDLPCRRRAGPPSPEETSGSPPTGPVAQRVYENRGPTHCAFLLTQSGLKDWEGIRVCTHRYFYNNKKFTRRRIRIL